MKRRKFIQTSAVVTLPLFLNGMEVSAIAKSSLASLIGDDNDRVLVLIQLNGGNDGLNTLIPLDQYAVVQQLRPGIILPENQMLNITDKNALNPAMTGMANMFNEGKLAIVQDVSYPNQNRSHFRSTDIWTTASDADQVLTTGWFGRYFDLKYPGYPTNYPNSEYPDPFAITLGFVVSETCQGASSNYSFAISDAESLTSLNETVEGQIPNTCYGMELNYVKETIRQTNAYTDTVADAFDSATNLVDYPTSNLGDQLKIVANLIAGGLKTKIYVVSIGGFDTHANQVTPDATTTGTHAGLLADLSDSIAAFQADIDAMGLGHRVVGMTFSEFGRRIRANESYGTDHGTAAPLFVFGNCVDSKIFGANYQYTTDLDDQAGIPMQFDFRSVYATVLMDWFGATQEQVEAVMFDDFQHIPFIKTCLDPNSVDNDTTEAIQASVFPNPASTTTNLNFTSQGGKVGIHLFDTRGGLVQTIMEKRLNAGQHDVSINVSSLVAGNYIVRITNGNAYQNVTLAVI